MRREARSHTAPRVRVRRKLKPFHILAVIPAMLVVLSISIYPTFSTIYHSFTAWSGPTSRFIGFGNYVRLFQDPIIRQVFLNSVIFIAAVPLIVFTSLVAAVLVYEHVWGWKFFRFVFFLPGVLSTVVVGGLVGIFALPNGILNYPLVALGLQPIPWLSDPWLARCVIVLALMWSSFGYGMFIILASMSTIDPEIYEAAKLDGASWWSQLWSITTPLISGTLKFIGIINVVYMFTGLFGFVYVITSGGPGFSTTTIDYYTFVTSFQDGQFGYGAALAVILFVIVGGFTIVQLRMITEPSD